MIDSRAVIDPRAELDEGVSVAPFAVIGAEVRIGKGSWIGPHAVLRGPTSIGRDNRIFQFASVGEDPQDMKYGGEPTRLEMGDGNTVREYATIHRGTVQDGGVTHIGHHNLLMAYTHVAHDCRLGDHVILANAASLGGHVHVEDWAILGGFTIVHQFCSIGAHAFCAMGSVVAKAIPPFVMVDGHPATARGVNLEGLRRRGFPDAEIQHIKQAFRLLNRRGLTLEQALAELDILAAASPSVRLMTEFIGARRRSILR